MLYGCDAPRISETVSENLKEIAHCFIEEIFSYIGFMGAQPLLMRFQNFSQID
jgi:hypothetical protein